MLASFATILPLISLSIAALTVADTCKPTKETKIAKYDDLPFTEGNFNPIPPHYYGLSYFTFQVDQYDFWIPPTSGNQWTMAFGGSGNISIPDSPPNQTFELDSFSFACVSGVPQPECAIGIWGRKANGTIIERTLKFPELGPAPVGAYIMNKTRFSWEWKGLRSLGFSIARADNGGDMFGGLALDDVRYTITTPC
ncbi:hypothetical protein P280DRAFT_416215 [Massarina eburnea CBS 473.64]|uniref:Ubiquitin 3 binding protein But2 C-terminal domain-containing protein n=1 Tax=Massarina eburnea CBS 473.64 TaxID=1395130 RepID=A0A6A6SGM9_9PLEO|nr:hypothetical protein P280DRAFT_416215 [Massarina eburnea CBS 473.64]